MRRAEYKVTGGKLIKVDLATESGRIRRIKITGDFFLHPEDTIDRIEEALTNQKIDESSLSCLIAEVLDRNQATLLGASAEDFAKCIVMAGEIE